MITYSMNRKINLGRYNKKFEYENVDIGVEGCESKEEATKEIAEWKEAIIEVLKPKPPKDPFPDETIKLTPEQENNIL